MFGRLFRTLHQPPRCGSRSAAGSHSRSPGVRCVGLHPLTGNRRGQWAIAVNGPWRICFCFKGGDAYEVEIVDYHSRLRSGNGSDPSWPCLETRAERTAALSQCAGAGAACPIRPYHRYTGKRSVTGGDRATPRPLFRQRSAILDQPAGSIRSRCRHARRWPTCGSRSPDSSAIGVTRQVCFSSQVDPLDRPEINRSASIYNRRSEVAFEELEAVRFALEALRLLRPK
jgi:RelE-like toxin of type II toxin-antitoxin system HigB